MAATANKTYTPVDMDAETTTRMLDLIEKTGSLPWSRGWDVQNETPRNITTGQAYQGGNVFIFLVEQLAKGYTDPYWVTVKQARTKWGCPECKKALRETKSLPKFCKTGDCPTPNKGEKGTHGVFWKPWFVEDKITHEKKFVKLFPRCFVVFNVCQFPAGKIPVPTKEEREFIPILECEEIGSKMEEQIDILHLAQSKAYYRPSEDKIVLPLREQFHSQAEYYSTRYHEMGHSTGHKKRLNRASLVDAGAFGDPIYSKEELVAELVAAMLCSRTGINNEASDKRSAVYLKGWGQKLREDKTIFLKAAREAQKAVGYILGEKYEAKEDTETTE